MSYIENGESALSIRNKMNEGLLVPATVNRSGTVLNITAPVGSKYIYFTAPSNYSTSDTYKINGVSYTLRSQNNTQPSNPWKAGTIVKMFLNGTTAYVEDFGSTNYLPLTGGTLTGDLRLKGSTNYGRKINFGDGDYVYIYEKTDDDLEIKATDINFVCTNLTKNGEPIGGTPPVVEQEEQVVNGYVIVSTSTPSFRIGPFKKQPTFVNFVANSYFAYSPIDNQYLSTDYSYTFYVCVRKEDDDYIMSSTAVNSTLIQSSGVNNVSFSFEASPTASEISLSGSSGAYYLTIPKNRYNFPLFSSKTSSYHFYQVYFN